MQLPSTVEEMQSIVLQGDLTENPYLQPHVISAKDKELKTNSKKIIPAINELLKQLTVLDTTIKGFTDETYEQIGTLEEGIEESVNNATKEMNQSICALQEQIQLLSEQYDAQFKNMVEEIARINEKINTLEAGSGAGTGEIGGAELKKVFHSKVDIPKGGYIIAPFKFSELQDINRQIVVTSFSSYSNKNVYNNDPFVMGSESGSLYDIRTYPVDFRINKETDEIILADKAKLNGHTVYFYTLE